MKTYHARPKANGNRLGGRRLNDLRVNGSSINVHLVGIWDPVCEPKGLDCYGILYPGYHIATYGYIRSRKGPRNEWVRY